MSSRSSGRARERLIVRVLEWKGWTARAYPLGAVFIGPGRAVGQRADVFGCDVEAVRRGVPYTLRIQSKRATGLTDGKRQIEAAWRSVLDAKALKGQHVELWRWGRWKRGPGWAFKRTAYAGGTKWVDAGYQTVPKGLR